jgi:hypothetical protein
VIAAWYPTERTAKVTLSRARMTERTASTEPAISAAAIAVAAPSTHVLVSPARSIGAGTSTDAWATWARLSTSSRGVPGRAAASVTTPAGTTTVATRRSRGSSTSKRDPEEGGRRTVRHDRENVGRAAPSPEPRLERCRSEIPGDRGAGEQQLARHEPTGGDPDEDRQGQHGPGTVLMRQPQVDGPALTDLNGH